MTDTSKIQMQMSSIRQKERERNQRERQQATIRPYDGSSSTGSGGSTGGVPASGSPGSMSTALFGTPIKSEQNDEMANRIRSTLGDFGTVQKLLLNDHKQIIGISTREMGKIHKIKGKKARVEQILSEMKGFPPITGLEDDEQDLFNDIITPDDPTPRHLIDDKSSRGPEEDLSLSGLSEDDVPPPIEKSNTSLPLAPHHPMNHKSAPMGSVKKQRRSSEMNGNLKPEDSSSESSASGSSSESDSESGSTSSSSDDDDEDQNGTRKTKGISRSRDILPVIPSPARQESKYDSSEAPPPVESEPLSEPLWNLSRFCPKKIETNESKKKSQQQDSDPKSNETEGSEDSIRDVIEAVARGTFSGSPVVHHSSSKIKSEESSELLASTLVPTSKRKTMNSSASLLPIFPDLLPPAAKKVCDVKDVKDTRPQSKKSSGPKVKSPSGDSRMTKSHHVTKSKQNSSSSQLTSSALDEVKKGVEKSSPSVSAKTASFEMNKRQADHHPPHHNNSDPQTQKDVGNKKSEKQKENLEPHELICSIKLDLLRRIPSRNSSHKDRDHINSSVDDKKEQKIKKEVNTSSREVQSSSEKPERISSLTSSSDQKRKAPEAIVNGSSSSRKKASNSSRLSSSASPVPTSSPSVQSNKSHSLSPVDKPADDNKRVTPPFPILPQKDEPQTDSPLNPVGRPDSSLSIHQPEVPPVNNGRLSGGGGPLPIPVSSQMSSPSVSSRRVMPGVVAQELRSKPGELGISSREELMSSDDLLASAKRIKHAADEEKDMAVQMCKYLEACMYFIQTGIKMEQKLSPGQGDPKGIVNMYKDTLNFLRAIWLKFKSREALPETPTNCKLNALSLRCLALLHLKIFRLKSKELRDNHRIIQSLQSEAVINDGTATLPNAMYQAMQRQVHLYSGLNSAHDSWSQSEALIEKHPSCKAFIKTLDTDRHPLSLNSPLQDLVDNVRTGLKLLP